MKKSDRYDSLYQYYAERFGQDWRLMKAQAIAESNQNPDAISPVGAVGLAQFMKGTWHEWWDGTPGIQGAPRWRRSNPEANVRAQAAYLRWLSGQFKTGAEVLAAYNWGPTRVRRVLRKNDGKLRRTALPQETRRYIAKVGDVRLSLGGEGCRTEPEEETTTRA